MRKPSTERELTAYEQFARNYRASYTKATADDVRKAWSELPETVEASPQGKPYDQKNWEWNKRFVGGDNS